MTGNGIIAHAVAQVLLMFAAFLLPSCGRESTSAFDVEPWPSGTSILRIRLEGVAQECVRSVALHLELGREQDLPCNMKVRRGCIEADVSVLLEERKLDGPTIFTLWLDLPGYMRTSRTMQWDRLRSVDEGFQKTYLVDLTPIREATLSGHIVDESDGRSPWGPCVSVFRIDPSKRGSSPGRARVSGDLVEMGSLLLDVCGDFTGQVPYHPGEYLVLAHCDTARPAIWRGRLDPDKVTDLGALRITRYEGSEVRGCLADGDEAFLHSTLKLESIDEESDNIAEKIGTIHVGALTLSVPANGTDLGWLSAESCLISRGRFEFYPPREGAYRLSLIDTRTWVLSHGDTYPQGVEAQPEVLPSTPVTLRAPVDDFAFRPAVSVLDLRIDEGSMNYDVRVIGEGTSWRRSYGPNYRSSFQSPTSTDGLLVRTGRTYNVEYAMRDRPPIRRHIVAPASATSLQVVDLEDAGSSSLPARRLRLKLPSHLSLGRNAPVARLFKLQARDAADHSKQPFYLEFSSVEGSPGEFESPLLPSIQGRYDIVLSTLPELSPDVDTQTRSVSTDSLNHFVAHLAGISIASDDDTLIEPTEVSGGRVLLTVVDETGRLIDGATVEISHDTRVAYTDDWLDVSYSEFALPASRSSPSAMIASRLPLLPDKYRATAHHEDLGSGSVDFDILPNEDVRRTIVLRKN